MLTLKTSKQTVTRFAFSADGARLAVAGTGRKVHLWDLTAKKLRATVLPTFKDAVGWIGFMPDSKLFALSTMGEYATHDPVAGTTDSAAPKRRWWVGDIVAEPDRSAFYGTGWQARKWAFDGRLREVWAEEVGGMKSGRGGAVLTPDGRFVAGVMANGTQMRLHTRDAATGAFRTEQALSPCLTRDLTLLPDGRLAFVREQQYKGKTPNALVVGTIGGKFEVIQQAAGVASFTALALHPSGQWLAVGQDDGLVRTFETSTWNEMSAHQWPVKPVAGLAFAPDGLKAAAGGDAGKVVVWDVDL